MCSIGEIEVSLVQSGRLLREDTDTCHVFELKKGMPPYKVENTSFIGRAMWYNDLFKWKYGALGCDLSIGGVERDLVGVCTTSELLTGDRQSLLIFLLGFENEISVN